MPSDLGYSDEGFILPPLIDHQHVVDSGATEGALFAFEAKGLLERQAARRESLDRRVEKCAELWSNPGDNVYDPFGGIGSSGYVALKMGRKAVVSELKDSYFNQMVLNCQRAVFDRNQTTLF